MAQISAKEVAALRNKTGLSMMQCKKALVDAGGDIAAAEEALRLKMKGKMDERTDRAAGEGRVGIAVDGNAAAIVELAAETDFTARNDSFIELTQKIAEMALPCPAGEVSPTAEMKALIDEIRITTGENISITRIEKLEGDNASFGTYVHHDGKTAVLLQAAGTLDDQTARSICMHITAAVPRPQGVTRDDVPAEVIEREREFALKQAKEEGKNDEIANMMVEGKIKKLYSELSLLEQNFVVDPEKKIKDLLADGTTIVAFRRWQVGELAHATA